MFPWSDPQAAQPAPYAVGDSVRSGSSTGRVVSVDAEHGHVGVVWNDGDGGAITYPVEAEFLRKALPWE